MCVHAKAWPDRPLYAPRVRALNLLPISNDDEFERFCCEVAKDVFGDYSAQRLGRPGQWQGGLDIAASNRRGDLKAIGIQCRFMDKPDPTSKALFRTLKKKLTVDYTAALTHHRFDEFIFATTWPSDVNLRQVADALQQKYLKPIVIWSWDFLQVAVEAHPRLKRLFTYGGDATGVTLIDREFVDRIASVPVNSFQFYCGMSHDDLQWAGVAQNLDAPRIISPKIQARLDDVFARPVKVARVAAVVHGEGGSGKSTLLRRIAIERARAGSCVCWWVESIATFMNFDWHSVDENQDRQHLVFIDDWYRNVHGETVDFFRWLKSSVARNIRVLIGDRPGAGRTYRDYVYGGTDAMHQLLPAENRAILDQVVDTLSVRAPESARINVANYAFEQAPLFVSLFVLSYEAQGAGASAPVDFKDGVSVRFKNIIANQLLKLERDHRYCGYGRALAFLGRIYAIDGARWRVFSEDTLLATAEFFTKSSNQPPASATLERYPPALSALIHRTAMIRGMTLIRFNHDVIAERGLAEALAHAQELVVDAISDVGEACALLDYLIQRRVASAALIVWDWLARSRLLADDDALLRLLMVTLRLCADTLFNAPLGAVLAALPSVTLRQMLTNALLSDTYLFVRLGPSIVPLLTANRQHPGVKAAAHAILEPENFATLFAPQVVSSALTILSKEAVGFTAAAGILRTKNFASEISSQIVSVALGIVGKVDAERASQTILGIPNFAKLLPNATVCKALSLGSKSEVEQASREVVTTDDFARVLPFEIVSLALSIVDKGDAEQASRKILGIPNFAKLLPHAIVSNALRLGSKSEVEQASRKILTTDDFASVLPFEIVSHALRILREQEAGREAARAILRTRDFAKVLPHAIVNHALIILAGDDVGTSAAESVILVRQNLLELPKDIVCVALKVAKQSVTRSKAALYLLENVDRTHRVLQFAALRALANTHEVFVREAVLNRPVF